MFFWDRKKTRTVHFGVEIYLVYDGHIFIQQKLRLNLSNIVCEHNV
jgi:hypothetical protein